MLTATPKPPLCKFCKKRTDKAGRVLHPDCIDAWIAAQGEKIARKREAQRKAAAKVEKAVHRAALKEHRDTIPKLIARAQLAFNGFIRERDKDKGCFVCGRPFAPVPGQVQHAGHVRTRGAAGHLRFVEDNCMGECEGCNGPRGAKPHEIKAGAIARIGRERFEELEDDNTPHKWERDELRAIRAEYRDKLKNLQKN